MPIARPARTSAQRAALTLVLVIVAAPAAAQRPFSVYDPFYRDETARPTFHDAYAISGEVSYRPFGVVQGTETATQPNPLGVALRLDYGLAPHFDVGAIVDASGVGTGRSVRWSWLVAKYYWTADEADYSFRLAVDPDADGRVGFPQADFAFLASNTLSPRVSSDFAIGARRVQRGFYERIAVPADLASPAPPAAPRTSDNVFTRALGWELHVMASYNVHLGPSGSRVFATLSADRGDYTLHQIATADAVVDEEPSAADGVRDHYRGGVVWLRQGLDFARPSYRVSPFVGVPVAQWTPEGNPRARTHLGVELTLR